MTTINPHSRTSPVHSNNRQATPKHTLSARWTIAPEALPKPYANSRPHAAALHIELSESHPPRATLQLTAPGGRTQSINIPLPSAHTTFTLDDQTSLLHADAPGVASLTAEGNTLLFARTPLLANLGIAGGRYELHHTLE
jgi:hypothetical protein